MPRLDNSLPDVIAWFGLKHDPKDPEATLAVDLCVDCAELWDENELQVDHLPYEETGYICCECGKALGKEDN